MKFPRIVIDTNVLIAALRSRRGASFRLLSLIGKKKFEFALSVPLVFEYEDVAFRQADELRISLKAINAIIDRLCFYADLHEIFFLWRPCLPDPKDDMLLEVAVAAQCDFIISYNKLDLVGVERFGIRVLTSKEFLVYVGELS